jgi:hypothetical protein
MTEPALVLQALLLVGAIIAAVAAMIPRVDGRLGWAAVALTAAALLVAPVSVLMHT